MKNIFLILSVILVLNIFIKADVAPDPGYMKVSADLIIETKEDLSDYRFFLDFHGDYREVKIKSNGQTVIPSMGGGVRYSVGVLLAVPSAKLKGFEKVSSAEDSQKLLQEIERLKKDGSVIELTQHSFSKTIPVSERSNWSHPTYRIERDGTTLKVVDNGNLSPKISLEEESQMKNSFLGIAAIIGTVLVGLAVVIGGIVLFRKSRKIK